MVAEALSAERNGPQLWSAGEARASSEPRVRGGRPDLAVNGASVGKELNVERVGVPVHGLQYPRSTPGLEDDLRREVRVGAVARSRGPNENLTLGWHKCIS